eukprot:TRINITY_DN45097_c0_g1_i1.p1 TRINITY_DN45097_c0_g1~~TRINITY_DN45097_c0_g1_i1.p1  ORF type:complete len:438 (+),score=114.55 TRINITY_DN45097_c0_g1_i1:29-1315(+)
MAVTSGTFAEFAQYVESEESEHLRRRARHILQLFVQLRQRVSEVSARLRDAEAQRGRSNHEVASLARELESVQQRGSATEEALNEEVQRSRGRLVAAAQRHAQLQDKRGADVRSMRAQQGVLADEVQRAKHQTRELERDGRMSQNEVPKEVRAQLDTLAQRVVDVAQERASLDARLRVMAREHAQLRKRTREAEATLHRTRAAAEHTVRDAQERVRQAEVERSKDASHFSSTLRFLEDSLRRQKEAYQAYAGALEPGPLERAQASALKAEAEGSAARVVRFQQHLMELSHRVAVAEHELAAARERAQTNAARQSAAAPSLLTVDPTATAGATATPTPSINTLAGSGSRYGAGTPSQSRNTLAGSATLEHSRRLPASASGRLPDAGPSRTASAASSRHSSPTHRLSSQPQRYPTQPQLSASAVSRHGLL